MTDFGVVGVSSNQSHLQTHYSHLPKELKEEFEKEILEFGFTLDELASDRNKRIIHNARYMKDRISKITYKPAKKAKKLF
jgi:hypothetical protein